MANIEIVVDDGRINVPIKNKNGETLGSFSFNPTDVGIAKRYDDMVTEIEALFTELKPNADGTMDADKVDEVADKLCGAVNKLLQSDNAAQVLFGYVHPFTPTNGVLYFETVLEAVGKFITAQFDAETKKITKRIGKYTKGLK